MQHESLIDMTKLLSYNPSTIFFLINVLYNFLPILHYNQMNLLTFASNFYKLNVFNNLFFKIKLRQSS